MKLKENESVLCWSNVKSAFKGKTIPRTVNNRQPSSSLEPKLSCLCMKIDSDSKDIERVKKDQTLE